MQTPPWVLLAVAIIPAAVTWLYNRHRPRVDYAKTANEGLSTLVDQLQEEVERLTARVETAETSTTRAADDAAESRRLASYAVAENAALVEHHLATVRGVVDGTVPPWLSIPDPLRNRISHADYPPWPPPETEEE